MDDTSFLFPKEGVFCAFGAGGAFRAPARGTFSSAKKYPKRRRGHPGPRMGRQRQFLFSHKQGNAFAADCVCLRLLPRSPLTLSAAAVLVGGAPHHALKGTVETADCRSGGHRFHRPAGEVGECWGRVGVPAPGGGSKTGPSMTLFPKAGSLGAEPLNVFLVTFCTSKKLPPRRVGTSSAQAAHPSLRRLRQSSLAALRLLSPSDPLRWAPAGAPFQGRFYQ